jgi:hypothetical protein
MASHSAASARSRNARASISVFSISDSYKRAMPKATQSPENNAVRTGSPPPELLRSPSRNFKNVTGANRNSRQLTEIDEALERNECFFDTDQPLSDLI